MTYRSLQVEEYRDKLTAEAPDSAKNAQTFVSLNAYTFPASAEAWGRQRGHAITYIDNAWVRVAVDAIALREFLNFGKETEIGLEAVLDRVDDNKSYVIEEEEF